MTPQSLPLQSSARREPERHRSAGRSSHPKERRIRPGLDTEFRPTEEHRRTVIEGTMQDTVRLLAGSLVPLAAGLTIANWLLLTGPARTVLTVLTALTSLSMAILTVATRRRPLPPRHAHWVSFVLMTPVFLIGTLRWAMTGELHAATSLALATVAMGGLMLSTAWVVGGMALAVVCWFGAVLVQPFDPDFLMVGAFQGVAIFVGSMLHVLRRGAHHRIGDLMAEAEDQRFLLAQQARVDELTGVLNRRGLMAALDRKIERSQPPGSHLAVLMIDLDNFKRVNDTWGHPVGDAALQEFARRVQRALRITDVFGRYGGEEFACILPETDGPRARQAAERIREEVAGSPFRLADQEVTITASIGMAFMRSGMRCDARSMLESADQALLRAKAEGKNRVVIAESVASTSPASMTRPSPTPA